MKSLQDHLADDFRIHLQQISEDFQRLESRIRALARENADLKSNGKSTLTPVAAGKSCLWGRSSPRQLGESVWRGFWKQLPRQASNNWHHPDLYSGKVPTLKDGLTVQLRRLVGKKNHRRGVKVFGKDWHILQTAQSICFTNKNHCRTQVSKDLRRELVQATWSRDL